MMNFSFAQEKTVTGTVSDASGPLPGVTVVVKNTTQSTQTDMDGKYSIKAKQGDVLEFSFLGMETSSVAVGASNTINFAMKSGVQVFDEVVITGYNSGVKRSNIAGSVSVVSAEQIENKPIASFDQILQGSAPGLYVTAGSGQPGASAKVRIRGTHSINGSNEPLYIVDGMPILGGEFATINPNDFESVSVLKDAAATSIYGSRGSNGVILVTTKKGKFDSPTVFKYSTQYGVSEVGEARFDMMNAREKMTFENYLDPGKWSDSDIANAVNTDWSDLFFRTGVTKTHDFSVSGGSEKTRFFTGLSYYDQEGISIRSNLKRFTYRLNFDHKASDRVRIGSNMMIGYSKSNLIDSENSITLQNPFAAVYLALPYETPYDSEGNFATGPGRVGANALENVYKNTQTSDDLKIIGNVYGEAELVKNLTGRVDLGIDYLQRRAVRGVDPNTNAGENSNGQQGSYTEANSFVAQINFTTSLRYQNTFAEKHDVSVAAFTEYYKYHGKSGTMTGYGIDPKLVGFPAGVTESVFLPAIGGSDTRRGLFSYFANGRYTYDSKYSIEATVRRDASSRFADDNKWATFWAVGASWNILGESFMDGVESVEELKLRASYGTTGNQNGIGDFQQQGTWSPTNYGGVSGVAPGTLGNSALVWESSNKFNVAVDFGLFDNWLSGTIEYYKESIEDLFIEQTLSATSGFPSLDANAGKMENTGIDIALKAYLVKNQDFQWSVNGNFNYNKNEITDLGQVTEYELGTSIIREGLPYGSHYMVGWAGVNPANGQPLYYDADGNVTTVYNAAVNSTANWGSTEPKYTGGFGTEVAYKGFQLSALFTFAADYYRFNNQTYFQENPNFNQYNLSTNMLNIWRNPGDVTNIQSADYQREFSSKDIEDASYTRLRNITLSYNFSKDALERTKFFTDLRVYVQAQNLYTWTNFTGFDPEDDNNIAQYEYPTPRTITLGFDFKF